MYTDLFGGPVSTLYKAAYGKIKSAKPGMVFVSNASKATFTELYGDDFRFLETIRLFTRVSAVDGETLVKHVDLPGRFTQLNPFLAANGLNEVNEASRKNSQRGTAQRHLKGRSATPQASIPGYSSGGHTTARDRRLDSPT